MREIKYKININVLSGFHITSGNDEGGYLDKYTVKTFCDGSSIPYIPGSAIKGKARDNFYMILDDGDRQLITDEIFGSKGFNPSKVYFDDLHSKEKISTHVRYGVSIDRYRKVSKDSALYNQEVADRGTYTGEILAYFSEKTIKYKEIFELSIKMIDSIGGEKSRGLGRVNVCIEEVKS